MRQFEAAANLPLGMDKKAVLEGVGIAVLATLLRLWFMAPYPTGWDDVDFALALQQYDLSRMQPHFPGYPIYILVAHLFYGWLHDPFQSLSALSAVTGGLTVLPLWLLFHHMGPPRVARLATWLYVVAPLPLVSSIQPMSDAFGAFLAAWLAFLVWTANSARKIGIRIARITLVLAGIVLGLLLGVRVSYLALSALWIWALLQTVRFSGLPLQQRIRSVLASAAATAVVCLAWLSAMVISEGGFDSFLALAVSFTEGHFTDWGGAYHSDASIWERAWVFFFRQIGAAGLGTVWTDAGGWRWVTSLLLLVAFAGLLSKIRNRLQSPTDARQPQAGGCDESHRFIANHLLFLTVWMIPYLIWAFFAQNIEKPRHILPILPPLLFLFASGIDQVAHSIAARMRSGKKVGAGAGQMDSRQQREWELAPSRLGGRIFGWLSLIWLMGTILVSYPLLKEAHMQQSPMMQLADYVKANISPHDSLIFTWEEQRVLNYETPTHTVIRLRRWEDFQTEVLQYDKQPIKVFATSALIDGFQRPVDGLFEKVITFQGSPWLYPTYHTIVLYRGTASLYDQFQKGKGETTWKSKRY